MIEKIWTSDPPYDLSGKYWKTKITGYVQSGTRLRLAAEAVSERRATDCHSVIVGGLAFGEDGRQQGLGRRLRASSSRPRISDSTGRTICAGCQEAGRPVDNSKWRVCRSVFVAATDEEARARVYSQESGYRHFFGHMYKVFSQFGRLGAAPDRGRTKATAKSPSIHLSTSG